MKYLREILLLSAFSSNFSPSCFVSPYGDSAVLNFSFSFTGRLSGVPYTVQDEENIILLTSYLDIQSKTTSNDFKLLVKYFSGLTTDSSTDLNAAKWITAIIFSTSKIFSIAFISQQFILYHFIL